MINNHLLNQYTKQLLNVDSFSDYCPNGLQIEGKKEINNIISGVSANLALIEQAIDEKSDAIFVHHGFFWKNENSIITGAKKKKISLLLENNINLYAFHLPLDAHSEFGNNIKLGQKLELENMSVVENSLVWQGELKKRITITDFAKIIEKILNRKPLVFSPKDENIKTIAWCTGGAQNYLDIAIDLGVDVYLSGEVSEKTPYTAIENNIHYISAGHHATERYGVQALCEHISNKFNIKHRFIEINNII